MATSRVMGCAGVSAVLLLALVRLPPNQKGRWTYGISQIHFAFIDLCITAVFAVATPLLPRNLPIQSRWGLFSWVWTFLIFRQTFLSIVLPATLRLDCAVLSLLAWHVLLGVMLHGIAVVLVEEESAAVHKSFQIARTEILGFRSVHSRRSSHEFTGSTCSICMQSLVPRERKFPRRRSLHLAVQQGPPLQGVVEILHTPCGHTFHFACVAAWVRRSPKIVTACPNCARPITKVDN